MTLSQLSSSLKCCPLLLPRIVRFLVLRGIFKEEKTTQSLLSNAHVSAPPITGPNSLAPLHLLEFMS